MGLRVRSRCINLRALAATPQPPKKSTSRSIGDGYPDWVNGSNRSFYNNLKNDPTLLPKVVEVMERTPSNTDAGESLVPLGLHKGDGSSHNKSDVSRIRGVAEKMLKDLQYDHPLDR